MACILYMAMLYVCLMTNEKMADQVHEFQVTMTCSGCSGAVERVLGRMKDKGKTTAVDLNLAGRRTAM